MDGVHHVEVDGVPVQNPRLCTAVEEEARSDRGVVLATWVLGGEVVAVRPDGEGS